jgi:hypothetical protein
MKTKYQSELLGVLHEDAVGLFRLGVISAAEMQEYDRDCLIHDTVSSQDAFVPKASMAAMAAV